MNTSEIATKIGVSSETVAAWERGDKRPTFRQAKTFARKLYLPFGYLYLLEPPAEKMPLADFRTTKGDRPDPSPDLLDVLNDVLGKQNWLREHKKSEGAGNLAFVDRYDTMDAETVVADDMRDTLDVDGARRHAHNGDEFLRNLVRNAEGSGIAVMRSGVIRGNPYRPLSRHEFRGFSISDRIAPLVFINIRDFMGAQIFTLAHEMAHIWTGKGGVSNSNYEPEHTLQKSSVERFCNRVAAETLVPSKDFLSRWRSDGTSLQDNLDSLRKRYKVSTMVVLRQALDNNLITVLEYQMQHDQIFKQAEAAQADSSDSSEDDNKSGGNFYRTLIVRNGRMFTEAVVASTAQGTTLSSEAAYMLGVKVKTLSGIVKHLSEN